MILMREFDSGPKNSDITKSRTIRTTVVFSLELELNVHTWIEKKNHIADV